MKRVIILEEAYDDLEKAFEFYESQESGAGDYFSELILRDIEGLSSTSGIHPIFQGYFRKLSSKFPFAIYYLKQEKTVEVHAVLDMRQNPTWIRGELQDM